MRFGTRLVLGTFAIVTFAVLVALGGRQRGVPTAVLVALPLALVAAWIASRAVSRKMTALADAARAAADGTTPRFPRSGVTEIDALVEAIRRMHGDLAARAIELERERAGGNAIVNAMVEGVIAADARGRVVMANPAALRLLGYPPDATLPDLPALFRAKAARDAVSLALGGREVHDAEVELDDRVLSINARPLPARGAVVVMHDLTEVRRLEAVRRDFVANVSHELKTPLTSIAGYADTLADTSIDPETRLRFLAVIVSNARRMQRLVDDLLDLSRIEAGRWTPHIERIALEPLVREAWEPFQPRAAARGIRFVHESCAGATHAWVDPQALRQILTNLFDNALRYVGPEGRIACRSTRVDGGIEVAVEDNGSGVANEHLSRIFERFYRVDPARSRDEGGTGLGLAIVRHMVEAHAGRVDAESEPRQGLRVRCWFPDRDGEGPAGPNVSGA